MRAYSVHPAPLPLRRGAWRRSVLVCTALVAALLAACATDPIEAGDDDDDSTTFDDTFSGGAHPAILASTCDNAGCHAETGPGGGLVLAGTTAAMYSAIMTGGINGPAVNTTNASQSLLLTKGAGQVGHTGGAPWTTADAGYQAVLNWITAGAQNN